MAMLIPGLSLIGIAAAMDFFFRLRMTRIGDKTALLLGSAFNYRKYHAARTQYGWAAWPVFLMWALILFGILLLTAGFVQHFGLSPKP
jgi:hypothetical protein